MNQMTIGQIVSRGCNTEREIKFVFFIPFIIYYNYCYDIKNNSFYGLKK